MRRKACLADLWMKCASMEYMNEEHFFFFFEDLSVK